MKAGRRRQYVLVGLMLLAGAVLAWSRPGIAAISLTSGGILVFCFGLFMLFSSRIAPIPWMLLGAVILVAGLLASHAD